MQNVTGFIVCAIVIFFAGKKLSWYGDLIAEKTGMGKAWVGLILMATITSLPELMVGISSSAIVQSADFATGILGSCTYNLAILAMLDAFVPKKQQLFFIASSHHVLTASLSVILIALAGLAIYLPADIVIISGIGTMSILFIAVYILSVRLIYKLNAALKLTQETLHDKDREKLSLKSVVLYFVLFTLITITAALFIPHFAEGIANDTGMKKSFIGSVFIAASTSLPEIAVSVAAVRIGSVDMAVSNLLGSNIFNILILALDDVFYTKGVLLKDASDNNLVSVFFCLIMSAIAIAGFTYKLPQKKFLFTINTFLILCFYIVYVFLMYYLSL